MTPAISIIPRFSFRTSSNPRQLDFDVPPDPFSSIAFKDQHHLKADLSFKITYQKYKDVSRTQKDGEPVTETLVPGEVNASSVSLMPSVGMGRADN